MSGKDFVPSEEFWIPKGNNGTLGDGAAIVINGGFNDLESLEEAFNTYNEAVVGLGESAQSIKFLLDGAIASATTQARSIEEETARRKASIIAEARERARKTIEEAEQLAQVTVAEAHSQAKEAVHLAEKTRKLTAMKALQDVNSLMDRMRVSLKEDFAESCLADELQPSEELVAAA